MLVPKFGGGFDKGSIGWFCSFRMLCGRHSYFLRVRGGAVRELTFSVGRAQTRGGHTITLARLKGGGFGRGLGDRETPGAKTENFGLSIPQIPIFCSRHPVMVRGVISDEGIFKARKVRVGFGMAGPFRVLLLGPPPFDVLVKGHFSSDPSGGEAGKASHPGRPASDPALI